MDIVKKQQTREWVLLGLVGLMALIANLPSHFFGTIGVEPSMLMAVLGVVVILALFVYVRIFFFLLYTLLAIGANLPEKWAEGLGISKTPMLMALVAMVVISLFNLRAKKLPTGLEPKKRKQNPEATQVLLESIERKNFSYIKTLLNMDFDLDTAGTDGMTPLMRAAQRGEFKIVQMLIKRGASPLIVGPSGKASDVALRNNFSAVHEFLKKVEEVQASEADQRTARPNDPVIA